LETLLFGMLVTGFASGVHCVAMCGGFVAAFAVAPPIRVLQRSQRTSRDWLRQLALSLGRITSYSAAGAIAGALGGFAATIAPALPAQTVLFVLANVMLVLVGLAIAGGGRGFVGLEALAMPLWRVLQPGAARLLSAQDFTSAFAAGLVWGWLPCGLVYGALAAAMFAGSPAGGALAMLAFGLGTLPNLLAVGIAGVHLRAWMGRRSIRMSAAALVLGMGAFGLVRAGGIPDAIRERLLCL
jgi:uncharacterized protein